MTRPTGRNAAARCITRNFPGGLWPIFIKYRVDVVFAGHVHAYERNAGVECGEASATGPMYITLGNGGNHEGLYDDWLPKPEYRYV